MQPTPIVLSLGEPAGVGPDIFLKLALQIKQKQKTFSRPLVVISDQTFLKDRANHLGIEVDPFPPYEHASKYLPPISLLQQSLSKKVIPGKPNTKNAFEILEALQKGVHLCLNHQAHALVTGPIHKAVINEAGISFSGHTEYLAELSRTEKTVMMLAADKLRVALVTTHIPLCAVSQAITQQSLHQTLTILNNYLIKQCGIVAPKIGVCGLNPHAGEMGYLGNEEMDVIIPAIHFLKTQGFNLVGPLAADTAFIPEKWQTFDALLAMYHDQGLIPIKTLAFHEAVNVTLGLPFIRTSVDHGTAFDLAGTLEASEISLIKAIQLADQLH